MIRNSFVSELNKCPSSGSGVHGWMMRVANLGAWERIPQDEITTRIKQNMTRPPTPAMEVESAVHKAVAEIENKRIGPHTRMNRSDWKRLKAQKAAWELQEEERRAYLAGQSVRAVKAILQAVSNAGGGLSMQYLADLSPISVGDVMDPETQRQNAAKMIHTLWDLDQYLFAGRTYGKKECIHPVKIWAERWQSGIEPPPFWIPNPLTGRAEKCTTGKLSYRCDAAIEVPRLLLFEIDHKQVSIECQAAFLASRIKEGWPIRAITYSGSKSLHALLNVECRDLTEWEARVRCPGGLMDQLTEWGADPTCRNPSRLSRMPGHFREDKGRLQSLLWLSN